MDPKIIGPKDAALIILAAATLAATTTGAAFDFAQGATLQNGQFAPGGGGAAMLAIIPVTSAKVSATDETYTFKIQTSPDNVTWTDYSRVATVAAEGVAAGGAIVLGWFQTNRYARIVVTIGGTAPTITLGDIYIQPCVNTFAG